MSVSDRFISELNKLAKQTHPPKDIDARVEHIIRGMAHLQVRVFPEDDLDVSADFLHDVARWFANAHGTGVKLAYAEMLNKILHPIVQVRARCAAELTEVRHGGGQSSRLVQSGCYCLPTCRCYELEASVLEF